MKMIYQIKHTKQNFFGRNFIKIFFIFLLVAVFIFLFSFFNPTRSLVLDIFSPFLKTGNYFYDTFNKIPNYFSDRNKLVEENEELLNQIENNLFDKIDYESVKYENQKLREELGLKPSGNFKVASIVAKPPQIPLDTIFLDNGTTDGVNNGDFVLVAKRVLIGKIVKVSSNRSTVVLNSFTGVVSYGFIARTNEPVEIKGIGGGNMEVKVPIDFDIVMGDKIMVSGSLNYLMAVVGMVEEDHPSGFKNILMSLPVNVSKISVVFLAPAINE
ncbi:MAG: rod shape-determining protein MreC [Patescibacteria group bacterium]